MQASAKTCTDRACVWVRVCVRIPTCMAFAMFLTPSSSTRVRSAVNVLRAAAQKMTYTHTHRHTHRHRSTVST